MIFRHLLDLQELEKLNFSIFPAEPRRPDVWISFSFLAWDLEIHPRTHIWFSTSFGALEHVLVFKIWIMHTEVTRSLSEPRALLREAPVCKKLIPKLVPIRPKNIPRQCWCMSWHHAKFHDFQACFGFTGIKKPSFSIFMVEPRRPDVWISFSFLSWDLDIHPKTHMWFFNQFVCTGACACSSNLNYAHKVPRKPS